MCEWVSEWVRERERERKREGLHGTIRNGFACWWGSIYSIFPWNSIETIVPSLPTLYPTYFETKCYIHLSRFSRFVYLTLSLFFSSDYLSFSLLTLALKGRICHALKRNCILILKVNLYIKWHVKILHTQCKGGGWGATT